MKTQLKTTLSLLLLAITLSLSGQTLFSDSNKRGDQDQNEAGKPALFSGDEASSFLEEERKGANSGRFSSINLNELRKTVLNQMMKDELIDNKRARVYLFLTEEGITFNDQKLSKELNAKYTQLLAPFEIGTGPDRTVFLSKDCTAVGDFKEDAFHGKMQGRLRIEYTQKPFEF